MADKYNIEDAKKFAAAYRRIMSDTSSGELAWKRAIPQRFRAGMRDGDQYLEEGQYKSWEEVDSFGSEAVSTSYGDVFGQPAQGLPEDHANKAMVIGITPSASIYLRKKYFRTLASSSGWSRAFQAAVTNLMKQKSADIAMVETLTKFKYMYGVREESDGALTTDSSGSPIGQESNHYRTYWYGDNVGNKVGGILEITNFTQFNTSLGLETADLGSCSISIEDPYNLLFVSKRDIDRLFKDSFDPNQDPAQVARMGLSARLDELQQKRDAIVFEMENGPKDKPTSLTPAGADEVARFSRDINQWSERLIWIESRIDALSAIDNKSITQTAELEQLQKSKVEAESGIADLQDRIANNVSTGMSSNEYMAMIDDMERQVNILNQEIDSIESEIQKVPEKTVAQLTTGEFIHYKRDVDYLYQYVAGRSIFSVMDEIYIWISSTKEDLFAFSVVDDLVARLNNLQVQQNNLYGDISGADEATAAGINDRITAMNGEMEDIRGRLSFFGYTFNQDGTIQGPGVENGSLMGYTLTNGMQVFSGIISSVAESWSDGVYTINISASNNFKYLEMSRSTPCGSAVDSFGLLDTPVRLITEGEKPEWYWLWGAHAMSGLAPSSNNPNNARGDNSLTYAQAEQAGLTMLERVYSGYDAANLISTIICGVPFDPNMQLSISIPDKQHEYYRSYVSSLVSTPAQGNLFVQQFRRISEMQNRVLGNFIPFAFVPADILAYETSQFLDGGISHSSDPNTLARANEMAALKETQSVPLVQDDKSKDIIIKNILGDTSADREQYSTIGQLNSYKGKIQTKIENLRSLSNMNNAQDTEDQMNAYVSELQLVDGVLRDQLGAILTKPYKISDIVSGYPIGDSSNPGADASAALTYRDAQSYLLINKREDIVRNIDQTYVVIDMTYLASPSARAFINDIRNGNESVWQTERLSQRQQVQTAADQLDWELFADTQGNIVYRRRQFNRIPASVYKRKIVPYVEQFVSKVLGEYSDLFEWIEKVPWQQREADLVKYLPGISTAWVIVYNDDRLRAQILEQDYPIADYDNDEKYAGELLKNSTVFYDESAGTSSGNGQYRARYHTYITDEDILSWSFNENEGVLSRIDVNGQWDYQKSGANPTTSLPTALTGAAVDYDLWFHYGYKREAVTKAWLRDASLQIPMYALTYLAHAKAKILGGSVTVVGNPFYQPGEVVYIESRNMLYYVTRVSHSFSYSSGDFKTTLTLEYGHYPGVWIADPYYLQATSTASGVTIHDKDELPKFYENVIKNRNQLMMSTLSGASSDNIAEEQLANQNESGFSTGTVIYSASASANSIDKLEIPKTISATFDPVVINRLKASLYFRNGVPRGIDYNKVFSTSGGQE